MALYDRALENWPVPCEAQTIRTRHGHTHVIACGPKNAPPLVMLHGAGTNSAIWGPDVAVYSRDFRIYAIDLLGEAGKSSPNRPSWEGPAYAEWLEDVFDALRIERAALLGISQGGWTALKFAVSHPERVAKLVLMCPGGITPDRLSFLFKAIGLSMLGPWGVRRMVRTLYGSLPAPEGVEDIFTTMMGSFKARTGILPIFTDDALRRLTMPSLLIGGTEDALRDNMAIAARLRALLPCLDVSLIPKAGHALPDTTGIVLPFLTR